MEGFAVPIDGINGIGAFKTVMHPFLIAHHLFTGINERNTLRGKHRRLCQFIEPCKLFGSNIGNT